MAEKLSSTKAFNEAVKPFIDHKNAYQEYKGTKTEGDIPKPKYDRRLQEQHPHELEHVAHTILFTCNGSHLPPH